MSGDASDRSRTIHRRFREFLASGGRDLPFTEQLAAVDAIFAAWPGELGPAALWHPTSEHLVASNAARLMADLGVVTWPELHRWSVAHRDELWREMVDRLGIRFATQPTAILDASGGPASPRWLVGAELNIVESCFAAPPEQPAVVIGREGGDDVETVSYGQLGELVGRVAGGLAAWGVGPGTRVALYLPMTVACVAAYLAVIRLGGVVVSVADSFSAGELGRRLTLVAADAVITASSFSRGGRSVDLYAKVVAAGAPRAIVIAPLAGSLLPAFRPGDCWWDDMVAAEPTAAVHRAAPDATVNILFSSGTTGTPKVIPWTHLTPVKCAADGFLHQDIRPGDVVAWPTNIGWMMGPWLIFASLVNRATMALYEGAPTAAGFLDFVRAAGVTMLGVVPSLVRAWRALPAADDVRLPAVRVFSSTGEPSHREDALWLMARAGFDAPVIEYCGGTEVGGGYVTGSVVQPAAPATFTTPAVGLDLVILDDRGRPVPEGEAGEVFLVPPSIGLSQRLLDRDHRAVYFDDCPPGPNGELLRRHGDQMVRLPGGFFKARGRADDTMNLGGIKVSSLEIEQAVETHPAVREAAAVGIQRGGEGAELLVLFVVVEPDHADGDDPALKDMLYRTLARELNPLFKVADLVRCEALPRTASNKLMRRALRDGYRPS